MRLTQMPTKLIKTLLIPTTIGINLLSNQAFADLVYQYEAEQANYAGGAAFETEHAGFTGSGYLGGFIDSNKGSANVNFSVNLAQAGQYELSTRFANGTGSAKSLSLYVDNQFQQTLTFSNGNGWAHWLDETQLVTLSAGTHDIRLSFDNADSGNINLDSLTLVLPDSGSNPSNGVLTDNTPLELEQADLLGGTQVESNHGGYSGSGFVGGFVDANQGAAATAFDIEVTQAGNYQVALTYANGTGSTRTVTFNGNSASQQISMPATGAWNSWNTVTHNIYLT